MAENVITSQEIVDPIINCSLQVALNPENTVVYVRQGTMQCFSFTSLKCCCNSTINIDLIGSNNTPISSITTALGTFTTNLSGICLAPLNSGTITIGTSVPLTFRVTSTGDGCINTVDMVVVFVYDPCRFCCKSHNF